MTGKLTHRLGQADRVGHDVGVLLQHHQGLAHEGLGLVAHLGQLPTRLVVQRDQPGQTGFDIAQRRVDGGQVLGGQGDGKQVLAHFDFLHVMSATGVMPVQECSAASVWREVGRWGGRSEGDCGRTARQSRRIIET
ncbi:hypothetical protein [Novilysobacter avium]|uniref:Uncharacterized protein n=1 Tax=Novilysobacter avium TaxID=2781023 RepID=A0A7S6ZUJ5_9GAMM|nr:hypothetical protein [Lysobacter avium]QOW21344.1 hypothetical protein INQ42_08685 [Lysobacter avium]